MPAGLLVFLRSLPSAVPTCVYRTAYCPPFPTCLHGHWDTCGVALLAGAREGRMPAIGGLWTDAAPWSGAGRCPRPQGVVFTGWNTCTGTCSPVC